MPLSSGCHHVAVVTGDLDRFLAFYVSMFDAEVQFVLEEGPLRHAMIDLGGFSLHPFAFADGHVDAEASPATFGRGHIDHVAIRFDDVGAFEAVRRRLVEAGVSDGVLTDFGRARVVQFRDPDGMVCEIAIWADGAPLRFDEMKTEAFAAQ